MVRVIACLITICLIGAVFFGWPSFAVHAGQERKAIKLDPRIYDAYVGQYELTPEFIITVRREENGLSVQATNQPKFDIFGATETTY